MEETVIFGFTDNKRWILYYEI